MRKIFLLFLLFFSSFLNVLALEELDIITREEWWANSEYLFIDSKEWKNILNTWVKYTVNWVEDNEDEDILKKTEEQKEALAELRWRAEVDTTIREVWWRKLAWPIEISSKKSAIVIHHTAAEYENSYEWVRNVYKFHALSRKWWDIWYNYIIGYNWEIFEGRAWWDKAVWAHVLYNNRNTIGISILWNYQNKDISKQQYDTLLKLTSYLVEKHDIDLSKKVNFYKTCTKSEVCYEALIPVLEYPIIGHRDAGHTSCPWEELYKEINGIFHNLAKKQLWYFEYSKIKFYEKFDKYKKVELLNTLYELDKYIEIKKSISAANIRKYLLPYLKEEYSKLGKNVKEKFVTVRLSYENTESITVKVDDREHYIIKSWDKLFFNWVLRKVVFLEPITSDTFSLIIDWEERFYKWSFTSYIREDGEVIVANIVDVEDYLKWLVYSENKIYTEKLKTMTVLARTNVYKKIRENKKAEDLTTFYTLLDDEWLYGKYVWVIENEPNNLAVDSTTWLTIKHKFDYIDSFLFEQSDWKVYTVYDLCMLKKNNRATCNKLKSIYPYLKTVNERWWENKESIWNGFWIPISGIDYLSSKWWNYEMIINYFFTDVNIQ